MHHHEADDDEGHQVVQRKEPVQRRVVDGEAAPQPGDDGVTDQRNGREQVGDDGGAPEAHLTPGQHVAHERGGHHGEQDEHADHPQKLARGMVGAVIEPAEHMDIDHDEEHRAAVHVDIADQPTVIDVTHDAFDRVERMVHMRRIVHGEHDAGDQHDAEHDAGQRTEVPPVVQVFRRRIVGAERVVEEAEHRQAVFDPFDERVGIFPCGMRAHVCGPPQPILTRVSVRNE